jgi:hypothetical protein
MDPISDSQGMSWSQLPRIAALGATGVFGSQFFFSLGVKLTDSNDGAIMQACARTFRVFVSTLCCSLSLYMCAFVFLLFLLIHSMFFDWCVFFASLWCLSC